MPDPSTAPEPQRWANHLRVRLAGLHLSGAREAEIVEELSQHLEERYQELRAEGVGEDEARRLSMDELLEPGTLAEHMRPLRQAHVPPPLPPGAPSRYLIADSPHRHVGEAPRGVLIADLWQDFRYAARALRKQPAFAAAAILTLALGIGANSAIFALVDATLLRPLPFPNPDRLVMMFERTDRTPRGRVSPLNMFDWAQRSRTIDALGGFIPNVGGMVMAGADGTAETVPRQWVAAGVFNALGVAPIVGRTFLPSDDTNRANVVVLNEAFWRSRFNADPAIVGRDIRLDGDPYTVVGVVPHEAQVIGRASIWALVSIEGAPPAARAAYPFYVIGRLKPEVTLDAASADMSAVARGLAQEFPKTNTGRGVTLEPLSAAVVGRELRQTSMLFLGAVGVVLLICCANVANLLLTRATVRKRELAIRSALGADRPRVIRQLLTESIVLALIGGALGVLVGATILDLAPAVIPENLLPAAVTIAFDARVVTFCAVTALVVGLLFGFAPAWQATDFSSAQVMASGSRGSTGRGGRLQTVLVVAEVATAVVLLCGAGLLLRTLLTLQDVDRGYRAESVLTMVIDPLADRYQAEGSLLRFYQAVEGEVRALPGVRSVAWATTLPLGPSYTGRRLFDLVGEPVVEESQREAADFQIVSDTYFDTLDLPIVAGRRFTDRDTRDGVAVCMVNEAFVRRYLQGRSPIGMRLATRPADSAQSEPVVREIVGVARQVKERPDEIGEMLQIYVPLAQNTVDDMFMLVRPVSGRGDALASSVRAAIGRVDKEQLVSVRNVRTLETVASAATARYRFRALLVMTFAALALVLAMVGVFGVVAYSVEQRVRDVGVRRALGATTVDVLRLVMGSTLRVVVLGAFIGLGLSIAVGRFIQAMLFGVQPLDPTTLIAVALLVVLTAAVSVASPAWRASRIDPIRALRE